MDNYPQGTEITFTYDSMRSGIHRERRVIVEEWKMTGKGLRLIAMPLDSESGREGPRTFIPGNMTNVRVAR